MRKKKIPMSQNERIAWFGGVAILAIFASIFAGSAAALNYPVLAGASTAGAVGFFGTFAIVMIVAALLLKPWKKD